MLSPLLSQCPSCWAPAVLPRLCKFPLKLQAAWAVTGAGPAYSKLSLLSPIVPFLESGLHLDELCVPPNRSCREGTHLSVPYRPSCETQDCSPKISWSYRFWESQGSSVTAPHVFLRNRISFFCIGFLMSTYLHASEVIRTPSRKANKYC